MSSPLKPIIESGIEVQASGEAKEYKGNPRKGKKVGTKAKWKKIAKEVGKAQDAKMVMLSPKTSKKWLDNVENLFLIEGRSQKRVCDRNVDGSALFPDKTTVAAVQHRQEQ